MSNIVIHHAPRMSIEDFAQKHNLTLNVRQRTEYACATGLPRWYASFDRCETKRDCFLESACGNGHTPDQAILDYLPKLMGKVLVVDALRNRREIVVNCDLYVGATPTQAE